MSLSLFLISDQNQIFWERALEKTQQFKSGSKGNEFQNQKPKVGFLFFEPSSRTRWSFERAALNLGLSPMVSVVDQSTSLSKGETLADTLELYFNLGFDLVVGRAPEDSQLYQVIQSYKNKVSYLNAGWGCLAHPTQAFLDVFTWWEATQRIDQKILILGDVAHSRVARSHLRLSKVLGYQVGVCPFEGAQLSEKEQGELRPDQVFTHRQEALSWADVVMSLRSQKERHTKGETLKEMSLKESELKPHQWVMHPGPFLRGVDLEETLIHHRQSLIFKQKQNGVWARMALLNLLLVNSLL